MAKMQTKTSEFKYESANQLTLQTVWPFVVIIIVLLVAMMMSLNLLSSVRAYVGGESLWSKGQKQAIVSLGSYIHTHSEADFRLYQKSINIPLGDHKARLALNQPVPDVDAAYNGFIQGANLATDVPGMIRLYRYFGRTPLMEESIRIWAEADTHIEQIVDLAQEIHREVSKGNLRRSGMVGFIERLNNINNKLTPLEESFTRAIANASLEATYILNSLIVAISIILTAMGLIFSRRLASQRLESSKALVKEAEMNLAYLRNASDGIHILDRDGNVLEASDSFCSMLGYKRSEVIGMNISKWQAELAPEDALKRVKDSMDTTSVHHFETVHKRKDGKLLDVEVSAIPIDLEDKRFLYTASRDISERKKAEAELRESQERLRHSQRLDAIGKLTGGIAHDFNNMLGVILGYSEILKSRASKNSEDYEFLEYIYNAGERAKLLVKKLLGFSSRQTLNEEVTDLNSLILENQFLVEKSLTAAIELRYSFAESVWPVMLDKTSFSDSFLNILINSMHAMPEGGRIEVSTENVSIDTDLATKLDVSAGEYLQISFKDSGVGMPKNVKDRIFEPFFTTKGEGGTGLGLAQVYGFVRQSRGAVQVSSAEGVGTIVTLFFPRYYGDRRQVDTFVPDPASISGISGGASILVVDDEEAIAAMTKSVLESAGYTVYTAHGGEEALSILENTLIDILISDIIMPGMNGNELANRVSELYPKIRIQLMSGYNDVASTDIFDKSLIGNLLEKPINNQVLLERVKLILPKSTKAG